MTPAVAPPPPDTSCWAEVGVWGDGSCPELPRVGHCRNCERFVAGGRRLLDRTAPDDYIESWTASLAEEKATIDVSAIPHLVFRVGRSWLAFRGTTLREISEWKTIRLVPHRPRDLLLGLVNVRGELHPCLSLHTLFGEEAPASRLRTSRLIVAGRPGEDWVFPVDEIDAMHEVAEREIEPLPATLTQGQEIYTRGLFQRGKMTVAVIDEELLFSTLARRIG